MMPTTDLLIAGEWVPVVAVEGGQAGEVIVILGRLPITKVLRRELVVILRQGPNREPMRFAETPRDTRLRLRAIY
jgi:hypothetical protein|uniref:hypothetical protein n=1 Tax=Cephaloticoccus sp. TaxID=1985742 RepID=UPI0040495085